MKFNPSWQQVALLTVLLSAVIVSHVWAPASAAAVVSLASTTAGFLFGGFKPKEDETKNGGE